MVDVVEAVPTGSFVVVVGAVVEVGAPGTMVVVVVVACFLPQSVLAASARFFFGWEDTYSPWLLASAQLTTLAAWAGVFVVVVDVLDVVVEDVLLPATTVVTIVDEVVVSAPAAMVALSPRRPMPVQITAVPKMVRGQTFMVLPLSLGSTGVESERQDRRCVRRRQHL